MAGFNLTHLGHSLLSKMAMVSNTADSQTVDLSTTWVNLYGYTDLSFTIFTMTSAGPSAAVPEPSSWALSLGGFGAVAWRFRRKSAAQAPLVA